MSTNPKCSECNKTVYPLEKVTITDGRNFHKACFKCFTCKSSLRPGQHFVHDTKIYCKPHYAAAQGGQAPKQETPRETPQETTPREPEPVHTPTGTADSTVTQALYAKLESEHTKKQVDSKKDLADIEAQVQRALSHSRSSSSIKSLNLTAALSPRGNNAPSTPSSANTSTSSLTTTQEAPTLMEEVTVLISPRITAEEEDAFFKEQMDKLEEEEEARKKTKKSHTPRKSEDHQRQKEEKLKALKEKKALRQTGQSNDVANVNLSAVNAHGDTSPRPAEHTPEPTIQITAEESNTNAQHDAATEGATRGRKGSWALKPTTTTRRGSITSQGPVVVGVRSKSDEHAQALDQAKESQTHHNNDTGAETAQHPVKHESTALVDPVPTVQKAISLVDQSMASVEAFFGSLGVAKPHAVDTQSQSSVSGDSESEQFIARVAQIKSTAAHDEPAPATNTNNTNTQHDTVQHGTNTLSSGEFDDFVNKIEEIKGGSNTKKNNNNNHNNNNNKPKVTPVTPSVNVSTADESGGDPHHYYWDFLKSTPNPEPASNHKSSHADPNHYYWDFLAQTDNGNKRRGSWAVKPTGTGRRGSVTSGEFRAPQHNNTQSTQ